MQRLIAAAGAALLSVTLAVPAVAQDKQAMPNIIDLGCDAFEAQPAASGSIDVLTGATIVITLCSNPTTGFSWSAPATSDASVVSVSGWTSVEPPADMAGAPGSVQVTAQALAAGTATISSSYDQPWDGGQKGAWTAELTVNVHDGVDVAISCDAFADQPHAVQDVTIAAGQAVVLQLCSNPTTGYSWGEAASSDDSVASAGSWVYEAPAAGMMGASGTDNLMILGLSAGTAQITASYGQPWDGGAEGDWTVELTVTVS